MKLRLEFLEAKSSALPNVIRLCMKFKGYELREENGLKIHCLELEGQDLVSFEAIWQMVWGWKGIALYVDGRLCSGREIALALERWRKSQSTPMARIEMRQMLGLAISEIEQVWQENNEQN